MSTLPAEASEAPASPFAAVVAVDAAEMAEEAATPDARTTIATLPPTTDFPNRRSCSHRSTTCSS